ncbi:MAG TPA: ATP-binding protein [bacterium]|nr:ATP-binding protein [bacterium]
MPRLLFTSLRTRLILLVLLPVVPMLALSLYSFSQQRAQALMHGRAEALRLAREAALEQEQSLTGTQDLLKVLSQHPQVQARQRPGCNAVVSTLMSPFFVNLAVAGLRGEVLCSAVTPRRPVTLGESPEFRAALEKRAFAVGRYRREPVTGRPTLPAAYPVIAGGRVVAVAVAALDLGWLARGAEKIALPQGATVRIFDADGVVLAGVPQPLPGIGERVEDGAVRQAILARRSDATGQGVDPGGGSRLIGVTVVTTSTDPGRVYVSVGIPTAVALAEVRRTLAQGMAALALIAALAVFGAWVTGNALILRPVRTLAAAVERLRRGDLTARSGLAGATELGRVGRAFDEMAAALDDHLAERRRAEEALTRSNRELGLILRAAGEGIFGLDLRGYGTFVNPAAAAMLGWGTEDLVGQPIHSMIHHQGPDASSGTDGDCPIYATLSDGTVHSGDDEVFWRKDGSSFPIAYTSTPIREGGKVVGAVIVFTDVTERRRAEVARVGQEAAEQANRAKSEFISRMSHELRTPLNAVLGFAQLLEMDSLAPDQQEAVQYILKAGRHLLDLITEVLDIARIEAGRLAISPEAVPVQEIVSESLALIAPLAAAEGIRLEDGLAGGRSRYVLADRQRLKQVLLNLLSNAVKYNRREGRVAVAAEETPEGAIRISVRDTGPGIDPVRAAQLFVPFERLDADRSGIEGTGLGLALSKRLVEAMGGVLGLQAPEGEGSIFWVEFPPADPPAPPDRSGDGGAAPASVQAGEAGRTVLYIDDDLSNVGVIRGLLAHRPGVTLLPAMQGRIGLDLAREHQPDLILLDLHLPDIPGGEVLDRLRADPETRHIPVVVISADTSGAQAERVRAAGAQTYLRKPLDMQQLLAILDEALASAAERTLPARAVPPP